MGLFVSAFAATEFQAVQFMPAFILPQLLLCGIITPRDELPTVLQWVSDVLPMSYAVDATQEVMTSATVDGGVLAEHRCGRRLHGAGTQWWSGYFASSNPLTSRLRLGRMGDCRLDPFTRSGRERKLSTFGGWLGD